MKAYVIDDRRGTRAEILPQKGATLVSLQKDGREFIYRDDENGQIAVVYKRNAGGYGLIETE